MAILKKTRYVTEGGFELRFEPIEETVSITKTDSGYSVRYLVQDDAPIEPGECDDDEGLFLVHYHRDFWVEKKPIITKEDLRDWYQGEKIKQAKKYYIFPVSALIHSGVWLSLNDSFVEDSGGWDTSHVGAILASRKEFTEEKALSAARSLIEWWNQYLSGDVYACVIERFNNRKKYVSGDECWGFYGFEYAKEVLVGFEG